MRSNVGFTLGQSPTKMVVEKAFYLTTHPHFLFPYRMYEIKKV